MFVCNLYLKWHYSFKRNLISSKPICLNVIKTGIVAAESETKNDKKAMPFECREEKKNVIEKPVPTTQKKQRQSNYQKKRTQSKPSH